MSLLGAVSRAVHHGATIASRVLCRTQAASFTTLRTNVSKPIISTKITTCSALETMKRHNSYDPYTDVETPSPYKNQPMHRIGYKYKYYTGGLLPRPDGEEWEKPLSLPKTKGDKWTKKKALFGQNDYIDILGDDNIEPWRLMQGPNWLKGFKGNEMQRLIRRMKFEGRYLKEMRPDKYHKMMKQIWYLYKKYNQRRIRSNFWGRGAAQKCRILKY